VHTIDIAGKQMNEINREIPYFYSMAEMNSVEPEMLNA
jgi:hypothetical protein